MPENQQQLPLHLAADILRDHLLLHIAEENEAMREDGISDRLDVVRDFLGGIDLSLRGGHVVSTSLYSSLILKNGPGGRPCLCSRIDCGPLLLTDFVKVRICVSGQEVVTSSAGSSILKVYHDDGLIQVKLLLSARFDEGELRGLVVLQGEAQGLGDDDLIRLGERQDEDDEQLVHSFATPWDSITYNPHLLMMLITPELRETIQTFGPCPTIGSFQSVELLPPDWRDDIAHPILSPSDESRLAIVTAIGVTDSQMELFDDNQQLKNELFHFAKIEERLGLVEISHTTGKVKLLLKDGVVSEGASGSCWCIPLRGEEEHSCVALNHLRSMECSVSGMPLQPESMGVRASQTGLNFLKIFSNGCIIGEFDEESIPGFGTDSFGETMQRTLLGEQLFTQTCKLKLTGVLFKLDSVQGVLSLLGLNVADCAVDTEAR